MTIEQFESYAAAGQIAELEKLRTGVHALVSAMGKNCNSYLNSIESRIGLLRRGGDLESEDVIEAQLDTLLGKSVGPLSDAGLRNIGIEVL